MFGFDLVQVNNGSFEAKQIIAFDGYSCNNWMIEQFCCDKLFEETHEYILILDGVVTNKAELIKESSLTSWKDTYVCLYEAKGERFFSELKGSFAGALYDKKKHKWIIFTDQLGSKFLFYTKKNGFLVCSSMLNRLVGILHSLKCETNISPVGSLMMLTYGFMLEDYTIVDDVHKIQPGFYITYENGIITQKEYYQLKNTPKTDLSEDEYIECIDSLFSNAVKRQFDKDVEYGKKHLVSLSAGLDSRMTSFVAHEVGYKKQLNYTFSQSNYLDETIPKIIASDLSHEWIYMSLDNGLWLYDVEEVTKLTGGQTIYYGSAHSYSMYKKMNISEYGMFHTGILGDAALAPPVNVRNADKPFELGRGAFSKHFIKYLDFKPSKVDIDNEIGLLYYRQLNGILGGIQSSYNFSESLSPSQDLDFLEFSLSIPIKYRQNHELYRKWIKKKYPKAASYIWERTGRTLRCQEPYIYYNDNIIPIKKLPSLVLSKLGVRQLTSTKNHMNPIAYYMNQNQHLNSFLMKYFDYIELSEDPLIRKVLTEIKNSGTALEKIQAVSLLASYKLLFT